MSIHGLTREDAEDLLHDVILVAIGRLGREDIENLEAWLRGTVRFFCTRFWRTLRRRQQLQLLERRRAVTPADQDRVVIHRDLARALVTLPEIMRRMIILRALGFLSGEIARKTGYSHNSVRQLIHRGMERLAVHFGTGEGRPVFWVGRAAPVKPTVRATCEARQR